MNKIFIVLLFILLGSSLIVINNIKGTTDNSFNIIYKNNKNISLPDTTGKTEIIEGLFRLYNANGITIDYNVYTGIYSINGTTTSVSSINITNINANTKYTISYIAHSGTIINGNINIIVTSPFTAVIVQNNENINKRFTFTTSTQNVLSFTIGIGRTFNNYQYKLQLEKGSQATRYVVPKLIPHYQDNLTLSEKEQIGFGAFGGITQIIRTINNIIKPVTDFLNGILSWF